MNNTIRWLHLSDFHEGLMPKEGRQAFNLSKIVDSVKDKVADSFIPDFVFVTGDLAQSGDEEQFKRFYETFINPLKEALPRETPFFFVPGNHDVMLNKQPGFKAEDFEASDAFCASASGLRLRSKPVARFANYCSKDGGYDFDAEWIQSEEGVDPKGPFDINGIKVGILLINTSWLCKGLKKRSDKGFLTPGIEMFDNAINGMGNCDVLIVLGHHPIDFFFESHVRPFETLMTQYNVIYLHGHGHKPDLRSIHENAISIRTGAAFQGVNDSEWCNSVTWAELSHRSGMLRLRPQYINHQDLQWTFMNNCFDGTYKCQNGAEWWNIELDWLKGSTQRGSTSKSGEESDHQASASIPELFPKLFGKLESLLQISSNSAPGLSIGGLFEESVSEMVKKQGSVWTLARRALNSDFKLFDFLNSVKEKLEISHRLALSDLSYCECLMDAICAVAVMHVNRNWLKESRTKVSKFAIQYPGFKRTMPLGTGDKIDYLELACAALTDSLPRMKVLFRGQEQSSERNDSQEVRFPEEFFADDSEDAAHELKLTIIEKFFGQDEVDRFLKNRAKIGPEEEAKLERLFRHSVGLSEADKDEGKPWRSFLEDPQRAAFVMNCISLLNRELSSKNQDPDNGDIDSKIEIFVFLTDLKGQLYLKDEPRVVRKLYDIHRLINKRQKPR
ncbi:MAG: metallophosphoesterase [Verrucomicrobiota bacterium]